MSEHKLNIKQKLFCDIYNDKTNQDYYGNASKCYMLVYNVKDIDVAYAASSRLLSDVKIKNYLEHKDKTIIELLAENSQNLIKKAFEQAEKGNTTILAKLLDKIIPTLTDNTNTNNNLSADDILDKLYKDTVNIHDKTSQSPPTEKPELCNIPVSASNETT